MSFVNRDEFEEYVGEALTSLPNFLKEQARLIRTGTAITMDIQPNRINIRLDDSDRVIRIFRG